MNSQGKITAEEFIKNKGINFMSPDFSIHQIIPLMEEFASHSQYTEKEESIVKEPNEYYCSFKKMCDQLDEEHKRQFCGCYNTPPKAIVKEPNEVEKPLEDISDGKVTVENFEQEFLDAWSQSNSVQSCLELIRKKGFKF